MLLYFFGHLFQDGLVCIHAFDGDVITGFYSSKDGDPTIPSNQIPVYIENENGSHVQIQQPLIINAAGKIVYGGQLIKVVTVEGHSMAIYDAYGSQVDYIPDVLKYDPDQLEQRLSALDGESVVGGATYTQIRASNVNGNQIKCLGRSANRDGGEGWFFLDASDTTTADDDGTVLIDAAGRRWKRSYDGPRKGAWFGVISNGMDINSNLSNALNIGLGQVEVKDGQYPSLNFQQVLR